MADQLIRSSSLLPLHTPATPQKPQAPTFLPPPLSADLATSGPPLHSSAISAADTTACCFRKEHRCCLPSPLQSPSRIHHHRSGVAGRKAGDYTTGRSYTRLHSLNQVSSIVLVFFILDYTSLPSFSGHHHRRRPPWPQSQWVVMSIGQYILLILGFLHVSSIDFLVKTRYYMLLVVLNYFRPPPPPAATVAMVAEGGGVPHGALFLFPWLFLVNTYATLR